VRFTRRLVLVALVILLGVGGAVAVVLIQYGADDPASGGAEPRPGGGVTLIAGRADSLVLSPAVLDSLPMPVTIEAEARGTASARIAGVLVDGKTESVAWGGGTPLEIKSLGGGPGLLALGPASVEGGASGLTVHLDAVVGRLTPGSYQLTGPVAIGAEGLGQPAESVTFEATETTEIGFSGTSVLRLPPNPISLEGPGQVRILGDLELTGSSADRRASIVESSVAPFRFDLVWTSDHIEIDGTIEGKISLVPTNESVPTLPSG